MDNNKNIYVTDGQDLAEKVEELVESGVTDVTVNVNTLNYTRYQKSHDGLELHPVIDGINKAVGKKLHIRLAVSLQEGFNEFTLTVTSVTPDSTKIGRASCRERVFVPV